MTGLKRDNDNLAASPDGPTDSEAIRKLGEEWERAIGSGDIRRLLALVTDDIVFMPPSAPSIVGKRALEDVYRAFFARYAVKQTFAPEEIQVSGDWAFARGTDVLTLEPLDGAPSMVVRARGVSIMKREQDGWKIARGITNLDQASGPTSPEKAG
jgi:uncharacterized protein (TIGR02246 family)